MPAQPQAAPPAPDRQRTHKPSPGGQLNKMISSLGIALAVTTAASGLGFGSVAQADDAESPPQARVVRTGDEFRVKLTADQAPDGETVVRIRPKDGDKAVAEVGGFAGWTCVGDDEDSCVYMWSQSAPFSLDDMGMYDLDVVVHKGREDEAEHRYAGRSFAYADKPRFTALTSSIPVLSYERRTGKASGTLVAEHPRTHEVKPLADAPVELVRQTGGGSYDPERLTTDGAGRFASLFTFEGRESSPALEARFNTESGAPNYSAQRTQALQVRTTPLKVAIRQPTGGITGRYGSKVPVQAALTWTAADGTARPLTNVGVHLIEEGCTRDHCDVGYDGTDANGVADLSYPVVRDGSARVSLSAYDNGGWFSGDTFASLAVDATHTTAFSPFTVTSDKNRTITVNGQLAVRQGSAAAGAKAAVDVQISADGKTGWKTVKTFTTAFGTTFSQQLKHTPEQDGHYVRVRYAGATDIGPTARMARLTRRSTQIVRDNLAPEGIRAGTQITASGYLQVKAGTAWLPVAGQKVRVYFKASAEGSAWTYEGSATTAANGSFSTKVTARRDGVWQIRYVDATAPYYASIGREDEVDVV
ncbi:hypothetical protein [Streptomyces sp. NPDC002082]|uniref:hypothetical protein n=1 Tax=Streptomyces sp. NPDC002082 TaxID=3154772 RepID=UPI0033247ADE